MQKNKLEIFIEYLQKDIEKYKGMDDVNTRVISFVASKIYSLDLNTLIVYCNCKPEIYLHNTGNFYHSNNVSIREVMLQVLGEYIMMTLNYMEKINDSTV